MHTFTQHLLQRSLAGACLLAAAAAPACAQDLLIKAGRIVVAPGTVLTDSALLVRDGKIAYVGNDIPAEARGRARTVDYGGATVSPGFVLAATTLGSDADLAEGALAFTPDLKVAEAFDPWSENLERLAPYGVTSFGLTPSPRNVAGGIGVLAKPGKERGRVMAAEAFVGFSLTRAARSQERDPTSLMGAREMLRDAFDTARIGVEIGPDLAVLRQVMAGSRRAVVHADTFAELNAALSLGKEFNFAPVIVGGRESAKVLAKLAERGAGVVLPTLTPTARIADLELPAALAEAGVPFCFAGRPDQLRVSAALAVRNGLSREHAHAALTRTPATLMGQQAAVGALRQNCSADFVVFAGDLLDLSARHVATWVDGVRVSGDAPASNHTNTKASR
jgi:imidazolonepropionase-like amidohydrolase